MKYLLLTLSFIFTMSLSAVELPAEVKQSVKKHCKGQVIKTSLKSFKGSPVYLVDTRSGSNIISYYFSPKGRLIHSRKNNTVTNKTNSQSKDRFDGFENEKKLTDKERRRLEEEEDGEEEDEDDEDDDRDEDEDDEDDDRNEDEDDEDDDRDEDEDDEDDDRDEDEDDDREKFEAETFKELNPRKLPKTFLNKIRRHIGNKRFEIGRETIYIVETREDGKNVTYIFTPKGNLLEREVDDEDEEDDDDEDEEEDED